MCKILLQLHNEGDSLMFQGFFKPEVASAEIDFTGLLAYQSAPKCSREELKEDLSIFKGVVCVDSVWVFCCFVLVFFLFSVT